MNKEGSDIKTAEDIPTAKDMADLEDDRGGAKLLTFANRSLMRVML